jgi:hypothetical protein
MNDGWEKVERIIESYVNGVRTELAARWEQWQLDLMKPELHEVVGALLARQVTLATQLASSPGTWNAHVAPILLRSMTDVHITLAWILKDPLERSRKFTLYGLGQQKLILEHRKATLAADGKDAAQDPVVKATEAWLNCQRFDFLTEVNVGSWSEVPVRDMAEEAGCLDLYRYAYTPFSAATHSMWHHVSRLNLQICENPLHRYHKVPIDPDMSPDADYLYRAAKYVEKSFKLFDQAFSIGPGIPSAFEKLCNELESIGSPPSTGEDEPREEVQGGQQGKPHDS